MSKPDFDKFLNEVLIKVLEVQGLENSFTKIALSFSEFFPDSKIWFAEKLGKRVSYLTGAGQESFLKAKEFKLRANYLLYIENIELSEEEKNMFIDFINLIIYLRDDSNES